jgi:hypothetical protein
VRLVLLLPAMAFWHVHLQWWHMVAPPALRARRL